MPRFTADHNVTRQNDQQKTVTIIDETAMVSSMQKNKQVFSPKQTFPPEPYIQVPSPIFLNIEEFMPKKPGNKTSNAFIIYRTVFAKVLTGKDFQNKMTDVSKWASISWKNEKADVISAYKRFAKEIQTTHKKRSQEALISRNRRLIAANTPRRGNPTISPRHEIPTYQQHTNLIYEQGNMNFSEAFQTNPFTILQTFQNIIPEPSEEEFQVNDQLNSMITFEEFGQSPVPSSIEEEYPLEILDEDFEILNLEISSSFPMQPMLISSHSEFQELYEGGINEPGWILNFN
ncbi:99_t:CDS:1 [Funneliformis geosporum]|uniref:9206_t:CDS:1 n=1 Tax=Funneliformis geosporum TaxID=1117311 RepID=A0A9W4SGX1_9GLOM|nr:99_t:CDS:1 [Funneliformis geosporum]CAI2169246.1 9206_t:CDS:1 [Funneliformis geosporum]